MPGLTPWNTNPEAKTTLKVANPERVKILQITDLHFHAQWAFALKDNRTIRELKRLADAEEPDLVMVTGDLWHDNPDGRGYETMQHSVERLETLQRPWLYVWGNHDQMDDPAKGHEHLTGGKQSLYRGGPGAGNYTVELTKADGSPLWQFVCLNSNRKGLGPSQHEWLKANSGSFAKVPAFVVAHIPLKQHADAWNNKLASGIQLESVCNEEEDGSSLGVIKGACDARAYFCGHDHVNDYSALVDGVDLIYGHATGHSGYGADEVPKGAKLITLNTLTGSYAWESILMSGERWKPTQGLAIDKVLDTPWHGRSKTQPA